MFKNRQCSLFRLVAGAVLAGVLSLTLAPVCGSAMDVDSELCCERHGCLSTTHNAPSSMRGIMHHAGGESETTLQYGSVGYNADRCCEQGQLNYPTSQIRASESAEAFVLFAVEFVVPVVQVPSLFGQELRPTSLFKPGPTPLYALHASFRI